MSLKVHADECIGCGGCEYACPTGALTKTDSFLGLFAIDPYTCDDCEQCVPKCPVDAIVADTEWPVCFGHGCPLSSSRLAGYECTIWQDRCGTCGGPLWRADATSSWRCPRCDDERKVGCPKLRQARSMDDTSNDRSSTVVAPDRSASKYSSSFATRCSPAALTAD